LLPVLLYNLRQARTWLLAMPEQGVNALRTLGTSIAITVQITSSYLSKAVNPRTTVGSAYLTCCPEKLSTGL